VSVRAVFFDVGETLVDEERYWHAVAAAAGQRPHVVWAALGKTIERGEEHSELWRHLGVERPAAADEIAYSWDDLHADALDCLERLRSSGMLVGVAGNQSAAMERWARESLPVDVVVGSESLGVRKPDPRFFERLVALARLAPAEVAYVGDRADNDARPALARRVPSPTRAVGASAGDARRRSPGRLARRGPGPPRSSAGVPSVSDLRIGLGLDAHAFADGIPLVLGGVTVEHPQGLAGHSDGDVVAHALTDALLGAAGLADIGALFPSADERYRGADSLELLAEAYRRVTAAGFELVNADCVLVGEQPHIAPYRDEMRDRLAGALGVDRAQVNVRATTTDRLGFTGRGEGLAAQAVALLRRR
jgi:2-C-methyl-D-erythritol 2,4-cyclodiphosphate synthase